MAQTYGDIPFYQQIHEDYMSVDVETRLLCARTGARWAQEKIDRLYAEIDGRGSTAWLARRQLPAAKKQLAWNLRKIQECLEEIEDQKMATAHPQIFHDLSEPFDGEVRQRKVGTRQADYITARAVMNRLDKVVGPENWRDEYTPQEHGILCTLSIRMPNGEWVSKSDAGGCAGMSDEADDAKSGYSDAFKRAAVKWGIGRHLYGEGIPRFLPEYDGPRDKHQFATYLKAIDPDQSKGYVEWIKEWGVKQGHPAKIAEWTPEHVMTAYPVLYKHIESDTK